MKDAAFDEPALNVSHYSPTLRFAYPIIGRYMCKRPIFTVVHQHHEQLVVTVQPALWATPLATKLVFGNRHALLDHSHHNHECFPFDPYQTFEVHIIKTLCNTPFHKYFSNKTGKPLLTLCYKEILGYNYERGLLINQ